MDIGYIEYNDDVVIAVQPTTLIKTIYFISKICNVCTVSFGKR